MHKVLVFAFGVIIGVCVDEFFLKDIKKKETKEDDRVMTKAPEEFKYTEDDFNKAVDKAEKIMNEGHYIFEEKKEEELSEEEKENEDDEEEDEKTELEENISYNKRSKEFLEKKADLIERIDYDDAFSGYVDEFDVYDDYGSPQDIYWFPESLVLTDGEGGVLSPIGKYMGDLTIDDEEEIFIRNNLLKTRYVVHSEENCSPDEFWG